MVDEVSTTRQSIVGTVVALLILLYFYPRKRKEAQLIAKACPNPNCVRCQRYRLVQKTAQSRYPWVAKDVLSKNPNASLKRIQASIENPTQESNALQKPTVLMLSNLPSTPVVSQLHSETCRRLQLYPLTSIVNELANIPDSMWVTNDSPLGTWKVLSFLNQGSWVFDICKQCPNTFELVSNLPNLLDDCLFGNIMISKIYPGTEIEPHCGPANIRHRLQYAIQLPKQDQDTFLRVGKTQLKWRHPGDIFVFDDSFVHCVSFPRQKNDDTERIVLIVDLWHPDLSLSERELLQKLYPPFKGG